MHDCAYAEQAVQAGGGGLVYIRVTSEGGIDAAKPVKEGLSTDQQQGIIEACGAQEVCAASFVCMVGGARVRGSQWAAACV